MIQEVQLEQQISLSKKILTCQNTSILENYESGNSYLIITIIYNLLLWRL